MHEIGVITQAVNIAIEAAQSAGARRVKRIRLKVGEMSGVVPEALRFGFDVVVAGTLAEGAILDIEAVPVTCRCDSGCGVFTPVDYVFTCPLCGRLSSDIATGQELDVAEVEIED